MKTEHIIILLLAVGAVVLWKKKEEPATGRLPAPIGIDPRFAYYQQRLALAQGLARRPDQPMHRPWWEALPGIIEGVSPIVSEWIRELRRDRRLEHPVIDPAIDVRGAPPMGGLGWN